MSRLLKGSYVIVKLDVMESGDKKALENPGGQDAMKRLGGENAGLPFMAVLDTTGKLLVNSNRTNKAGSNIGYPAAPEEIDHFLAMLKATAPRLAETDLAGIKKWLVEHAPKRG